MFVHLQSRSGLGPSLGIYLISLVLVEYSYGACFVLFAVIHTSVPGRLICTLIIKFIFDLVVFVPVCRCLFCNECADIDAFSKYDLFGVQIKLAPAIQPQCPEFSTAFGCIWFGSILAAEYPRAPYFQKAFPVVLF